MSARTFGLRMHLISFDLPRSIAKESDTIRVSITTIPEENKQHFTVQGRHMRNANLNFLVNVKLPTVEIPDDYVFTGTEKIIVVFRKKSTFWGLPIIASTFINAKDFPKNLTDPIQVQTFNIYEPVQRENKNNYEDHAFIGNYQSPHQAHKIERRIIGRMQVELSLTDSIPLKDINEDDMYTVRKTTSVSSKPHEDFNDENLMFIDNFDEYRQLK